VTLNSSADQIPELLGTLYSAAVDQTRWPDFMRQVSRFFDVPKASMLTHWGNNERTSMAYFGDGLAEATRLYDEYYAKYDGWQGMLATSPGRLCLGQDYWPERDMLRSEFYQDLLKGFDMRYMAAVLTRPHMGFRESLSLYRGHEAVRFDRESVAMLDFLYPHLETALHTRRRLMTLETRVGDLETALDQMACPLILVSASLRVVLVNRSARVILDAADGLILRNGRLDTKNSAESATLKSVLSKAVSGALRLSFHHAGAMTISRPPRKLLQLVAAPLMHSSSPFPGGAAALVFLTDPESAPQLPGEILQALYGLTLTETRLSLLLLEGTSLNEAAELHCVSKETVRTQIRSIYSKTGTNRQSELLTLLRALAQIRTQRDRPGPNSR